MNSTEQPLERSEWLRGPKYPCAPGSDYNPGRRWNLILLGGPGAGKGTQAELLAETLGACPLSTDDIVHHARNSEGDLSASLCKAMHIINEGGVVDDETTVDIIRERQNCLKCNRGFLLDGFPRTIEQAVALHGLLKEMNTALDAVISYELDSAERIRRLSGRRMCPGCGTLYHLTHNPPETEGLCNHCGEQIIQRPDDQPDAIQTRVDLFERETAPIRNYYETRKLLVKIPSGGTPRDILHLTCKALGVVTL